VRRHRRLLRVRNRIPRGTRRNRRRNEQRGSSSAVVFRKWRRASALRPKRAAHAALKGCATSIIALATLVTPSSQDLSIHPQIQLTLTEGTSMAAAVSPDRRWIAIDLVGALWIVPIRGGEATKITADLLEARLPP